MKKTKHYFAVFLALVIFLTSIPNIDAAGNEEISETIKIEKMNIGDFANKTYTYELDAPKNFGELVSHSFENITGSTVNKVESVTYDSNRNKLVITFNMGNAITKKVDGYRNDDKTLFAIQPYNAVCRYSDGARWQINEVRKGKSAWTGAYYQIVDMTKYNERVPTNFVFDKITAQSQTRLDYENAAVGYWVDAEGNQYSQSQIKAGSRYVKKEAISFPKGMNVGTQVYFDFFEPKNPVISFTYSLVDIEKVTYNNIIVADFQNSTNEATVPMTGYAECHKYVHAALYYVSAETNPVSNIIGTFTYRYKTSEEPKIIVNIIAEPSQIKFNNNNIEVKVTLKAEVTNIKADAIKEYKLFLRTEDNTQNPKPEGYKKDGKILTTSQTETFIIPKSKLNDVNDYTEYFVGRAYAYLSNGKTLMSDLVKTSTYVYKDKPIVEEEEQPHEIKAVINGNDPVKLGDDTVFDMFGSYSTDSAIEQVKWVLEEAVIQPSKSYVEGEYTFQTWYDKLGRKRAIVYVKDTEGRQAGTYMDFDVVAPTIETYIRHTGTLKENRKITIIAKNDTPVRYPLSEITWRVQSVNGDLDEYIRHEQNLSGKTSFDVLFKKAGEYMITANTKNTAGYTSEATYIIEVKEDMKPQVDFDFQQKVYRDPNNQNLATFNLVDYSYSYDGDYVNQRNWYVIFDSNNDGVFNEPQVLFNTGNNREVSYSSSHVGKYKFILEAIEEFGEPTIDAYVTEADRRRMNTDAW